MNPYLQADHLTLAVGDKTLFSDITFGIAEGQRIGLIAQNGTGKTSLLNILAGRDAPDAGTVTLRRDLRVAYLEQTPTFPAGMTVLEACLWRHARFSGTNISDFISAHSADNLARRMEEYLFRLGITDTRQPVQQLSGGQVKRVALASVLLLEADMLILDEPTNHLDLPMTEWLEGFLARPSMTLLMVTHDRYFLDRVCTQIVELADQTLYTYRGNYAYFLEKRQERIDARAADIARATNIYRRELEWMRRQPQARGHKARYREEAFADIEQRARQHTAERAISLQVNSPYIGSKIFEAEYVSKAFADNVIMHDFYYNFARYEKLGIVGANGTGKSTFVRMLLGLERPDAGRFVIGETVRFGYFSQEGLRYTGDNAALAAAPSAAPSAFGSGSDSGSDAVSATASLSAFDAGSASSFGAGSASGSDAGSASPSGAVSVSPSGAGSASPSGAVSVSPSGAVSASGSGAGSASPSGAGSASVSPSAAPSSAPGFGMSSYYDDRTRVIDVARRVAEYVDLGGGRRMTAMQFLQHFLFTPEQQQNYVYKLSGGERRRLHLCTVLMQMPNFLILDEPTNDLDIATLSILEDYLRDFRGCVIVVSHDRYFTDKVVDHLLVFHGQGRIQDFPGNYTQFRQWEKEQARAAHAASRGSANASASRSAVLRAPSSNAAASNTPSRENAAASPSRGNKPSASNASASSPSREGQGNGPMGQGSGPAPASTPRRRLTFKERREMEALEAAIAALEAEKAAIETALCSGTLTVAELTEKSRRLPLLTAELDAKELRWLELSDIEG